MSIEVLHVKKDDCLNIRIVDELGQETLKGVLILRGSSWPITRINVVVTDTENGCITIRRGMHAGRRSPASAIFALPTFGVPKKMFHLLDARYAEEKFLEDPGKPPSLAARSG